MLGGTYESVCACTCAYRWCMGVYVCTLHFGSGHVMIAHLEGLIYSNYYYIHMLTILYYML